MGMTISLDLSISPARRSDLSPIEDARAPRAPRGTSVAPTPEGGGVGEFEPSMPQVWAQAAADRLNGAILSWVGRSPLPAPDLAMGAAVVASFADLLAGRLGAALEPQVLDLRDLSRLTGFSWSQVAVFGRFGWALDLPARPRHVVVHADGIELELDAGEQRGLASGIAFHMRHASHPEEREAWWCAVGRPPIG